MNTLFTSYDRKGDKLQRRDREMPHREDLLSVVTSSFGSPAVSSCSIGATSFCTYKCQLNHVNVYCRNGDNLNGDNCGHNGDESLYVHDLTKVV